MRNSECRIWTKQVNRRYGYGLVHRIIYEYFFGEIPAGYDVHHICNNPLCFNHRHLKAVSKKEHFAMRVKTHCKKGHLLSEDNVYWSVGKRCCRRCKLNYCSAYEKKNRHKYAEYQRAYKLRKKAKLASSLDSKYTEPAN